ncbi:MAG: GFA family protein [Alphaproteobacteria bacterium]|jgi:hypothetical protein|nr:GFA family protein [Alphaproteobacteria bacterium]
MTETREGGCACGAVRFRLHGEPIFIHACHCTDCQRLSASAFGISMIVEADRIETVAGTMTTVEMVADSGRTKSIYFCPACGSQLWNKVPHRPGLLTLKAGSLDAVDWFRPQAHIWTRSKQAWLQLADAAPHFETMYEAAELWPAESLERARLAAG